MRLILATSLKIKTYVKELTIIIIFPDEKLYFLEDWKPPYQTQVNLNRNTLETSSANSMLVTDFINITEEYINSYKKDDAFQDVAKLCSIVDKYRSETDNLNFDELKISLETLACWPQSVRYKGGITN